MQALDRLLLRRFTGASMILALRAGSSRQPRRPHRSCCGVDMAGRNGQEPAAR